jgi:hypothetical protein
MHVRLGELVGHRMYLPQPIHHPRNVWFRYRVTSLFTSSCGTRCSSTLRNTWPVMVVSVKKTVHKPVFCLQHRKYFIFGMSCKFDKLKKILWSPDYDNSPSLINESYLCHWNQFCSKLNCPLHADSAYWYKKCLQRAQSLGWNSCSS